MECLLMKSSMEFCSCVRHLEDCMKKGYIIGILSQAIFIIMMVDFRLEILGWWISQIMMISPSRTEGWVRYLRLHQRWREIQNWRMQVKLMYFLLRKHCGCFWVTMKRDLMEFMIIWIRAIAWGMCLDLKRNIWLKLMNCWKMQQKIIRI